jgi:1-acyl-sn-glycerol-3-phosphate acyltransferase
VTRSRDEEADQVLAAPGWWWSRLVGLVLTRIVWRVRVHGPTAALATGPFVLAINHVNVVDGPLVFVVCRRRVHFLVKAEMFRGAFGWVLRQMGQIPLNRAGLDRTALTTAARALEQGHVVGVFPEGARGRGDVTEVRRGVAWLGLHSGAPVVPIAVLGTRRSGQRTGSLPSFRRRLHVVVGHPFTLPTEHGRAGRVALAAAAEHVRVLLADHVQQATAAVGVALPEDSGRDPAAEVASPVPGADPPERAPT